MSMAAPRGVGPFHHIRRQKASGWHARSVRVESPAMTHPAPAAPTRARFAAAAWRCAMAAVLYLDRVCWGKAVPPIQAEFGLSNTDMACLAMAFQLAYGLFEVPTGRWGDLAGARAVLTRIAVWWSAFTALTGACTGFASLLAVRF